MQENREPSTTNVVIVRAYRNEPVRQTLYRIDYERHRAVVGNSGARNPISLPVEQVFPDYDGLFTSLSQAYEAGDQATLERLYGETRNVLQ